MTDDRKHGRRTILQRRYARRAVLRGAALAGMGLAGAFALACKGGGESKPAAPSGPAAGAAPTGQAGQAAPSLIGRSGTQPTNEQPRRGGTLNWYIIGNPPTLDPHRSLSSLAYGPVTPVLGKLYRFKSEWDVAAANNREVEPYLAQSIESPDAVTWIVKLRPDARFHDIAPVNGRTLEAEDVKVTFQRAAAPESVNQGTWALLDAAATQTPDRNTVVFKLKYPYAPFLKLVASGQFALIMPREGALGEYDVSKKVIGTGPFILDSYTPDVALTYKRNPNYFEQGKPYIDGAKIAIIPDAAQRMAQFSAGNIDFIGVNLEDVETVRRQNPRAELIRNWDPGDGHLFFQLGDPTSPFRDVRLRRALNMAIDRATYGKVLLNNEYLQSFFVSQQLGKWALRMEHLPPETAKWYQYNPQEARQLFEAAGGTALDAKIIYGTPNPRDPWLGTAGEMVFNMLQALPWKRLSFVRIDYNREWIGGGRGKAYGNYPPDEMPWWGIMLRADVDLYIHAYWHSQSTTNLSKFSDPKVDQMIEKARGILNEDQRVQAYLDIQKYLADQAVCVTGNPSGLTNTFVQPRVRNYRTGDDYGTGTWVNLWLAS
jgi:peptide/nickel transport system substrate-binding protein